MLLLISLILAYLSCIVASCGNFAQFFCLQLNKCSHHPSHCPCALNFWHTEVPFRAVNNYFSWLVKWLIKTIFDGHYTKNIAKSYTEKKQVHCSSLIHSSQSCRVSTSSSESSLSVLLSFLSLVSLILIFFLLPLIQTLTFGIPP